MSDGFQDYVRDVLHDLLERARDARAKAGPGLSSEGTAPALAHGRALAYYEVVSHLVNQLDAFGIDRRSVGVDATYDADRDLL
jgi:hypothetical protein